MIVERGEIIPVSQPSLHVPDKAIQQSIEIAGNCLHNSQLSGQFKVSSGYITSGNIVPDLSFGLFGVRRLASLNDEFDSTWINGRKIGSAEKAGYYRKLADKVEESVRTLYWRKDHFVTNIYFGGKIADEIWLDNQVWAIKYGIATEDQAREIWSFIDADQRKYEGIPMRWTAFDGPIHGPNSWFGRNGAGDILARYKSGNSQRVLDLMQNISRIFNRDNDIYEAYDMNGKIVQGTYGWGNYNQDLYVNG